MKMLTNVLDLIKNKTLFWIAMTLFWTCTSTLNRYTEKQVPLRNLLFDKYVQDYNLSLSC